jgi:hypothetical protein
MDHVQIMGHSGSLERNFNEAGCGAIILGQQNSRRAAATGVCSHLSETFRIRGCTAALFSQINGAAAKTFGGLRTAI